jgi:hypothetical protein
VGRAAAAGRRGGGGDGIPALRTHRLRLGAALAAALLAAALASYPLIGAGRLAPLLAALGALGELLVVAAAAWRGRGLAPALVVLGAEAVTAEATGDLPPASVVAYAAGLIVLAELLSWVGELPWRARIDASFAAERLLLLAGLALAGALLALVALAAGGATVLGGLDAALVGFPAAIALLVLPHLLVRRSG